MHFLQFVTDYLCLTICEKLLVSYDLDIIQLFYIYGEIPIEDN